VRARSPTRLEAAARIDQRALVEQDEERTAAKALRPGELVALQADAEEASIPKAAHFPHSTPS
jgi:hypothetical protein